MAKAVQGWLHTTKLDERYQTDLKMAMTKLEPKRIYWFVIYFISIHNDLLVILGKRHVIFLNHRIMRTFLIHILLVLVRIKTKEY